MTDRTAEIEQFLAASGWTGAAVRPLAGDASFRRYHRVRLDARAAVLMDAPPDREDVRPFVRIARHLHGLGLSAPGILAADEDRGLLLLEDFGDDTFSRLLAAGNDEAALYRLATDVLVHLHRMPETTALPASLPAYDERRLLDEALLLTDWFMPAALDRPTADAVRGLYVEAWRGALRPVLAQPRTLVLRDFHVDNLMRLPGRDGIAGCGLLDFQDAVAGPAAYDLMSLLQDARRDVTPTVAARMLEFYLDRAEVRDEAGFRDSFTVLAAQRHCKVIGIFTRLWRRDGKPAYLVHVPRVWRLLEQALADPSLAPLARWFDRHLPPTARGAPPIPVAAS